jgi:hypothetical protein
MRFDLNGRRLWLGEQLPAKAARATSGNMSCMSHNRCRRLVALLLLACLLLPAAGGCAFDRDWRRLKRAQFAAANSEAPPATQPADALAGRWEGKWVSEKNGHKGKLRAIIRPVDDTTYRVEYDATFLGVLRFDHGMNLAAARQPDGTVSFEGQEDLGSLAGGVYRYKGSADGRAFTSTYESKYDHGTFEMTRPTK